MGIDLYVRDCVNDLGDEPSYVCGNIVWNSPDIWIRNNLDGATRHQNPIYKSNGNPNYIYVRIKNRGCVSSYGVNDKLHLYWTKSNAPIWPSYWDGTKLNFNSIPLGGSLEAINIPSIEPGEEVILVVPWVVPNPEDYSNFLDGKRNYSVLARIVSDDDPMRYLELLNHYNNPKYNNNVAQKNVTIIDISKATIGSIVVENPYPIIKIFDIKFLTDESECNEIFREAEITFTLDESLLEVWEQSGENLHNIKRLDDKKFLITGDNASLQGLKFDSNQTRTLSLQFNFLTQEVTDKQEWTGKYRTHKL